MKNVLTILLASFILISGMQLSIARHFCGGEMADVQITFSKANASCGMDMDNTNCSEHEDITSNCCRNEYSMLDVDDYLNSSSKQVKEISQPVFELFSLPLFQSLYSFDADLQTHAYVIPNEILVANAVSLPKICVFRI